MREAGWRERKPREKYTTSRQLRGNHVDEKGAVIPETDLHNVAVHLIAKIRAISKQIAALGDIDTGSVIAGELSTLWGTSEAWTTVKKKNTTIFVKEM